MATKSALRKDARTLADCFRRYAAEKGWPSGEYSVYFRSRRGGILHVILVAPAARLLGGYSHPTDHREIVDFLSRSPENDELAGRVRLAVRSREQVDEGGFYAIGMDYQRLI